MARRRRGDIVKEGFARRLQRFRADLDEDIVWQDGGVGIATISALSKLSLLAHAGGFGKDDQATKGFRRMPWH